MLKILYRALPPCGSPKFIASTTASLAESRLRSYMLAVSIHRQSAEATAKLDADEHC